MRIARVLTRLNLGGPARQVLASDPELVARGHDVLVLAGAPEPGEGSLEGELAELGIDVRNVPGLERSPWAALRGGDRRARRFIEDALRGFAPDVVHTHASKAGAVGRAAATRAVPGARRVHTFHGHVLEGYFPGPVNLALRAFERRRARTTHQLVAVSEATRDDLVRLGVAPRERIEVCPPGTRLDALLGLPAARDGRGPLRRRLGVPPGAPLIGVLGRLAPVKRPLLALEVFAGLAGEFPEAHLAFGGDGALRGALQRAVAALPPDVAARVHLPGALTDVCGFHDAIDVLLGTSSSEGMPVAMIEAAAAARPVVSTAVGGIPEIVRSGVTGLFGASRDGLVAALSGLLSDPPAARAMGERARAAASERFTAAALADRLESIYRGVIAT